MNILVFATSSSPNTHAVSNATIYATQLSPFDQAAGAQAVNRSSVASLAFLVWDICITFDDEINLIWPRRWTPTKFLFFFVRLCPVLVQISILFVGTELTPMFNFTSHDCYIWQIYEGVAALLIVMAVDCILLLRVCALYHGSVIVMAVLYCLYVLEVILMSVSLALTLPGVKYDDICIVTDVPSTLLLYGAASIVFQGVLFLFTTVKFIVGVRQGWGRVPLVALVMRDGSWAFFLLFAIMIAQASLYFLPNPAYDGILYGWLLTAFSFAGYRILLNIQHLSSTVTESQQESHRGTWLTQRFAFTTRIFSGVPTSTANMIDGYGHSMELALVGA